MTREENFAQGFRNRYRVRTIDLCNLLITFELVVFFSKNLEILFINILDLLGEKLVNVGQLTWP